MRFRQTAAIRRSGVHGRPMSVNDEFALDRAGVAAHPQAAALDVLSSVIASRTLISRHSVARSPANPVKEIGWGEVLIAAIRSRGSGSARHRALRSFHWHGETFTIPQGAVRIMGNRSARTRVR